MVILNKSIFLKDWLMKIPQGPPGQKGDPGTCICNATALMSSFTMPKMIQGPKGEPGVPGQEGKQGLMGLTVAIFVLYIFQDIINQNARKWYSHLYAFIPLWQKI